MNEVQLNIEGNKGAFYIASEGTTNALMSFVFAGEHQIIIDHTEVRPEFNGKGYGKALVAQSVHYARENGIKIIPLCPFAKKVFDKTPEFQDVL